MNQREMIRKFIETEAMKEGEAFQLGDEDDLIASGILDSLGILKLLNYLEKAFSITLSEDELVPENFENMATIMLLVETKTVQT